MIGRDYFIIALFLAAMVISAVVYTKTAPKIKQVAEIDLAKDSVLTVKDANERVYQIIIRQQKETIKFITQDKNKTELENKDLEKENRSLIVELVEVKNSRDSARAYIRSLEHVGPAGRNVPK